MRHTFTAQVLARAIKDIFPTAKLAIGPTIEHGFYYDVDAEIRRKFDIRLERKVG